MENGYLRDETWIENQEADEGGLSRAWNGFRESMTE